MYGGVSLAIYINGVACEFFEAVRGRGVYGLLKHLTDSDITVDIVAGASAGGINGVFLGHALAAELEFADLARLWREHADIDRLLEPLTTRNPQALFRSEAYYQVELEHAFANLLPIDGSVPEAPSPTEALDLFITGTDYHGARAFRRDALGNVLATKDHRAVFRLKHRALRRQGDLRLADGAGNEARTAHHRALATLCRLTSTFPAAFAPTHVPALEPERPGFADHLARWGALGRAGYFIDGGVLDNKPFTEVIEQIYYRTAARPVARTLFYVEPDPEVFDDLRDGTTLLAPGAARVVAGALVGLPGYESVAGDLAAIDDRNVRLAEYARIADAIIARPGPPPAADDVYWTLRLRALAEGVVDLLAGLGPDGPRIDLTAVGGVVDALCRPGGSGGPPHRGLLRYDAEQALRRRFFVTYRLYDTLYGPRRARLESVDCRRGEALLHALNRHLQVAKLIAGVVDRFRRERAAACVLAGLDAAGPGATAQAQAFAVAAALEQGLSPLLGEGSWLASALATTLAPDDSWAGYLDDTAIDRTIKSELDARWTGDRAAALSAASVVEVLDEATTALLARFAGSGPPCDEAVAHDRDFFAVDARLFPIERLARLREKDPIATVRISPRDATLGYSARPAGDKVAGDRLGHFSGFLHRAWRSNDILWGRLDARCLLVQRLLDRDRLASVIADGTRRRELAAIARDLDRWLPDSRDDYRSLVASWLDDLLSDDADRRSAALAALGPTGLGSVTDALVRAAQDAVLGRDLPVLASDIGRPKPSADPKERADQFAEYAIGRESLADLPPDRMLGTAMHAALVARRVLFTGVARRGWKRALALALASRSVGALLWFGYWLATAPWWRKAVTALATPVIVAALIRPELLFGRDGLVVARLLLLIVFPALWLLFEIHRTASWAARAGRPSTNGEPTLPKGAASPAPGSIVPSPGPVPLIKVTRPDRAAGDGAPIAHDIPPTTGEPTSPAARA